MLLIIRLSGCNNIISSVKLAGRLGEYDLLIACLQHAQLQLQLQLQLLLLVMADERPAVESICQDRSGVRQFIEAYNGGSCFFLLARDSIRDRKAAFSPARSGYVSVRDCSKGGGTCNSISGWREIGGSQVAAEWLH